MVKEMHAYDKDACKTVTIAIFNFNAMLEGLGCELQILTKSEDLRKFRKGVGETADGFEYFEPVISVANPYNAPAERILSDTLGIKVLDFCWDESGEYIELKYRNAKEK